MKRSNEIAFYFPEYEKLILTLDSAGEKSDGNYF
jgi:hypothetical protein